MSKHQIQHGTAAITYELLYTKRKTVGIIVYPDQSITVRAPHGIPLAAVEEILHKKGDWILKKQENFKAYPPILPPPRYINGESHLYLGRRYRLQLAETKDEGVQLLNGRLFLHARDSNDRLRKQKLLEEWYRQQAKIIFPQRLSAVYPRAARIGIPFPELKVRKMKSRWGSCHTRGTIILNLKLIQTPETLIDYVILHELAHFKEPNHSKAYYRVLEALLPNWKEQRQRLNGFQTT